MKKAIISTFAILLAVVNTGCAKNTGKSVPTIEPASIAADSGANPANKSESENNTPPIETEPEVTPIETEVTPVETAVPENPYVGIYRNSVGWSIEITITEDDRLQHAEKDIDINNEQEDGSILAYNYTEEIQGPGMREQMEIYPAGVKLSTWDHSISAMAESDESKLRLFLTGTETPDIRSNVYYKVEPLKEGAISYLPTMGYTHEFTSEGVIPANGSTWEITQLFRYEESENGQIEETLIALTSDGESVSTEDMSGYVYYEDALGLYKHEVHKTGFGGADLRLKYPISVGATFQSGTNGTGTIDAIDETVTTAAGVFEDVVVVSYEFGEGFYGEKHYFAPGVGLVKYEATRSGGELVKISK